ADTTIARFPTSRSMDCGWPSTVPARSVRNPAARNGRNSVLLIYWASAATDRRRRLHLRPGGQHVGGARLQPGLVHPSEQLAAGPFARRRGGQARGYLSSSLPTLPLCPGLTLSSGFFTLGFFSSRNPEGSVLLPPVPPGGVLPSPNGWRMRL